MSNLFPNNLPQLMEILEEWEYSRFKGKKLPVEYFTNQCPEYAEQIKRCIKMLEGMDWLTAEPIFNIIKPNSNADSSLNTTFKQQFNECCKEFGYNLMEPIGHGGSGQIWKAEGLGGKSVAIKIISLDNKLSMKEIRALDFGLKITNFG